MLSMIVLYILMGFVMDSLAMILLTVPIFWPIIAGLDFGLGPEETKIWFGIISLIVVEMGLITPPVMSPGTPPGRGPVAALSAILSELEDDRRER